MLTETNKKPQITPLELLKQYFLPVPFHPGKEVASQDTPQGQAFKKTPPARSPRTQPSPQGPVSGATRVWICLLIWIPLKASLA